MKKILLFFSTLFIIGAFESCNEIDADGYFADPYNPPQQETSTGNVITYNGDSYNFDKGYISTYTDYYLDIYISLLTDGLSVDSYGDLQGSGNILSINVENHVDYEIAGDYSSNYSDRYLYSAGFFSVVGGEVSDYYTYLYGSVLITGNGNNYEITFDLTDYDGNSLTGTYSGTLNTMDSKSQLFILKK